MSQYQVTNCPRPYLESKIPFVVEQVNIRLKKELDTTNKNLSEIAKEVIQGRWGNGKERYV